MNFSKTDFHLSIASIAKFSPSLLKVVGAFLCNQVQVKIKWYLSCELASSGALLQVIKITLLKLFIKNLQYI